MLRQLNACTFKTQGVRLYKLTPSTSATRTGLLSHVHESRRTVFLPQRAYSTRTQRARASLDSSSAAHVEFLQGSSKRSKLSLWFKGVLLGGGLLTVYGGYTLYEALTIWPPEVRGDLRDALAAKLKGDLELSERYFHRAWDTILTLPLSTLGSNPYLKLTGVAASLVDVLEITGKPLPAYNILTQSIELMDREDIKANGLTGMERMRAVGLALKAGEMVRAYKGELGEVGKGKEKGLEGEEERWLVWAVEEVLRIVKDESEGGAGEGGRMDLPMVVLPKWMEKKDVGAPLEALAGFYERTGRFEYAMTLYLQAISLLIPPAPKKSSVEDRCRGAQLMTHLSSLLVSLPSPPSSSNASSSNHYQDQAESWASQALAIVKKSREESSKQSRLCEEVYAAALFNLGVFMEMKGEMGRARELFLEGSEQARKVGLDEGVVEGSKALKRVDLWLEKKRKEKEGEKGKESK